MICNQDRLSHYQCRDSHEREVGKMNQVVGENKVVGQYDNIEADRKEQRWWHDFTKLFDYESKDA